MSLETPLRKTQLSNADSRQSMLSLPQHVKQWQFSEDLEILMRRITAYKSETQL